MASANGNYLDTPALSTVILQIVLRIRMCFVLIDVARDYSLTQPRRRILACIASTPAHRHQPNASRIDPGMSHGNIRDSALQLLGRLRLHLTWTMLTMSHWGEALEALPCPWPLEQVTASSTP